MRIYYIRCYGYYYAIRNIKWSGTGCSAEYKPLFMDYDLWLPTGFFCKPTLLKDRPIQVGNEIWENPKYTVISTNAIFTDHANGPILSRYGIMTKNFAYDSYAYPILSSPKEWEKYPYHNKFGNKVVKLLRYPQHLNDMGAVEL